MVTEYKIYDGDRDKETYNDIDNLENGTGFVSSPV